MIALILINISSRHKIEIYVPMRLASFFEILSTTGFHVVTLLNLAPHRHSQVHKGNIHHLIIQNRGITLQLVLHNSRPASLLLWKFTLSPATNSKLLSNPFQVRPLLTLDCPKNRTYKLSELARDRLVCQLISYMLVSLVVYEVQTISIFLFSK